MRVGTSPATVSDLRKGTELVMTIRRPSFALKYLPTSSSSGWLPYKYVPNLIHSSHHVPPLGDRWLEARGKLSPERALVLGGGKNVVDLVHHTAHLRPGFTGGDRWLEARGKGGAEKAPGCRKDLFETL